METLALRGRYSIVPICMTGSGRRRSRSQVAGTLMSFGGFVSKPRVSPIESLESRRYFALPWTDAYKVVSQDTAAASFPSITGQGVTVAMLDTGVDYNHTSLGGGIGSTFKVKGGYDFVDNDNDPMDTFGHGTANAGILAALPYDFNGNHFQGIAPQASLVALRVSAGNDVVTYQTIERALQWIEQNYQSYGISVVNFSFGSGRYTVDENNPTISDELKSLADDGLIFFCPSGNQGGDGIMYPAADASVISVGSVNTSDAISSFTQRGSLLDLLAPGEGLVTLAPGNSHTTVSDASYCTPVAAGAAALIKQVDSRFSRNDILSILKASGVYHTDNGRTYPRVDLVNAITTAQTRKFDAASDVGKNGVASDLAYDTSGVLHFAYYDQTTHQLKYATRNTHGAWSATQIVDTTGNDVGATLSLAVDSIGRPAVAYYDATNGDLDYARYDGKSWNRSVLDSKNIVGQFASLAFDSALNPIVTYYRKTSGDLRAMRYTGSAWVRDEIDTIGEVGQFDSLDISNSGTVAVAYADTTNGNLKYAQFNGSTWTTEIADDLLGTPAFVSLAFDNSNNPAVSYYDAYPADLKFAKKTSGSWTATPIVSKGAVGLFTNLWFDDANQMNIVYYSRKSNGLFRVHGPLNNLAAETLTLAGGTNASAAATVDGSAATYAWFNPTKNKIFTGDLT